MDKADLRDAYAFALVAEERSFTRAAGRLGVSTSALSHQLRRFERRLGIQLLHRSTRSVRPTEAGASLLNRLGPGLAEIAAGLDLLGEWRAAPAGTVRITANRWSADRFIAPLLAPLRRDHPAVVVEVSVDDGLVDVIGQGFDLGIRPGRLVAPDMVAHRLEPDDRSAIVAAPGYLAARARPETPDDLAAHRCLIYRQVGSGRLYPWDLRQAGATLAVLPDPAFVTDDADLLIGRALAGDGFAYIRHDQAREHLARGSLVEVLDEWAVPLAGNHLYHASRRVLSPAIRLVVARLQERARG